MLDLGLTSTPVDAESITVSYSCPCGCTPAVTYHRDDAAVTEGCCCGNEMAVGAHATQHIATRAGFEIRTASVTAPWREQVPVVWAIGPSTHPESDEDAEHPADATSLPATVVDPVCGMTIDAAAALAKDLLATHRSIDYYFCGKGCKLDFIENPDRYLAPDYVPSM